MAADLLQARCRECHARLKSDNKRAAKLSAEHPNCECDAVSISQFSPGPVQQDERLARLVVEPKHLNPDGTIEVGSLRDVHENGLSLVRQLYVTEPELYQKAQSLAATQQARENKKAEKDHRTPVALSVKGVINFDADRVRQWEIDGVRRFCVMDSATETDPYHADIAVNGTCKGSEASRIRDELRKTLIDLHPQAIPVPSTR